MSRVMVFMYYCDNGKAAEHPPNTVEGDTVLVWSPKQKQVVELDICDDCLDSLRLPDLTDLADRLGREIEEPQYDATLICPHGCRNGKPFADAAGLARHKTRKHPEEQVA